MENKENINEKKILVIGSTVCDIIINLEKLPSTAEDVHIRSQFMRTGGCAYNVASIIRNFGVPYTLFSPVGTGIYGDFIRKSMDEQNLPIPMLSPDSPNGCCYCFVEKSGERTFVVDHGAEYLFEKEWFDALDPEEYSAVYICGLEIEEATGDVVIDFLKESGLPVYFAPGPRILKIDGGRMKRVMALNPVIHLNDREAMEYTGKESVKAAAEALFKETGNTVIVTLGAQGACIYDGNSGFAHIPGETVENVKDTIGAGDGHIGAVISCLYNGMPISEAVKTANHISALIVTVEGPTLPSGEFTVDFLKFG